ncbi:hypothetical protein PI126_g12731 [Phytophthora idaei]|nr:hypothetical protein PI126_g12731 [Phytophthora idaei]
MMDVTRVDEKYFYMTVVEQRFILLRDEPGPYRKLKSKRHITKVMMWCARSTMRRENKTLCIHSLFESKENVLLFDNPQFLGS